MKARFTEQQPKVRWQPLNNGKVDVTICLNEQTILETVEISSTDGTGEGELEIPDGVMLLNDNRQEEPKREETEIETTYEYDFHQFREYLKNIKKTDVENFPEQYMDYQPKTKEETDKNRLEEMERKLDAVLEAIVDRLGEPK